MGRAVEVPHLNRASGSDQRLAKSHAFRPKLVDLRGDQRGRRQARQIVAVHQVEPRIGGVFQCRENMLDEPGHVCLAKRGGFRVFRTGRHSHVIACRRIDLQMVQRLGDLGIARHDRDIRRRIGTSTFACHRQTCRITVQCARVLDSPDTGRKASSCAAGNTFSGSWR